MERSPDRRIFELLNLDDLGRAKELKHLYNNIQKINIPFTVCMKRSTVEKALLDSSTMDNFIDPIKVEGLKNWPWKLDTLKQVRSMLGILGYQRPFIPGFAHIAQPLTNLLKKGTSFLWTNEHTQAVDKLINITLNDPVLYRPDPLKQFILEVDTLAFATRAILYQEHEGTR